MAAAAKKPSETIEEQTEDDFVEVPQTSIATRGTIPGEVTVQFQRWTQYGLTAYQKGQYAGFMRPVAEKLVKIGAAVIVLGGGAPGPRNMVQK